MLLGTHNFIYSTIAAVCTRYSIGSGKSASFSPPLDIEGFPVMLACWYDLLPFSLATSVLSACRQFRASLKFSTHDCAHARTLCCAARFQTVCNAERAPSLLLFFTILLVVVVVVLLPFVPLLLSLLLLCSIDYPLATQRGANGTSGTYSG